MLGACPLYNNKRHKTIAPFSSMAATKRAVSPSLRAAARLDGEREHSETTFKLATTVAMATLDTLAESDEISSNAYNRMAKRLKLVYDSRDMGLRRVKGKVVTRMAAESPSVLLHAPVDVDWVNPYFVKGIMYTRADEGGSFDDDFIEELVTTYLGDPFVDLPAVHVRNGLMSLLKADSDLLGPRVLQFLRTSLVGLSAADIFELCSPACACALHNCAFGMMLMAIEYYPDREFYNWLVRGIDRKEHAILIEALGDVIGIKKDAPASRSICTSPSLR